MRARLSRPLLPVAVAALALGACDRDADTVAEMPPSATDTLNEEPLDGLSRTQLEHEAVPMTPEAAEARGLVDTTIHLENLGPKDTIVVPPPGEGVSVSEGETVLPDPETP